MLLLIAAACLGCDEAKRISRGILFFGLRAKSYRLSFLCSPLLLCRKTQLLAFCVVLRSAKKDKKREKEIARMPSQEDVGQAMQYTVSTFVHLCRRGFFSPHTHTIYKQSSLRKRRKARLLWRQKKMYFFSPSPLASSSAGRGCITSFRPAAATHLPLLQSESTPDRLFFTGLEKRERRGWKESPFLPPPQCLFLPLSSSCLACEGREGPCRLL